MKQLREAIGALRQNVLGPLAAVLIIMIGHWLRYGELTQLDIITALIAFVVASAAVAFWKAQSKRKQRGERD